MRHRTKRIRQNYITGLIRLVQKNVDKVIIERVSALSILSESQQTDIFRKAEQEQINIMRDAGADLLNERNEIL
jgi:hypothetical protein